MSIITKTTSGLFIASLVIGSGCASQSAVDNLQTELQRLSVEVTQSRNDSAEALRIAQNIQTELEDVKRNAASASEDARATRESIEQMNARLDQQFGSSSLK
jgi:septal ring factor EnvC (AmiA/AmiB activator)